MKSFKKALTVLLAMLMVLGFASVSYAADALTPEQVMALSQAQALYKIDFKAKIGNTLYENSEAGSDGLAYFFAAYQNTTEATVKLESDIILPQNGVYIPVSSGQTITLDFNGHKIIKDYASGHQFTGAAIEVQNGGELILTDSKSNGGIVGYNRCILNEGTLTVNGGLYKESLNSHPSYAISNEGNMTMNGGTIDSAHYGILNSGTATIKGGTVESSASSKNGGAYAYAISSDGAITVPSDSTLFVNGTHGGLAVVGGTANIAGGTYTADDYYGLYVANTSGKADVTVSGGSFTGGNMGGSKAIHLYKNESPSYDDSTLSVSGGTFASAVPEEYCADGYVPVQNGGGQYTVDGPYVAQIGDDKYKTLAAAVAAVKSSASSSRTTITLLADVAEIPIIDFTYPVQINGNGHAIAYGMSDTSTVNYAMRITASNADVVLDNLVVGNWNIGRGVNVNAANVKLTVQNGSKVYGNHYPINVYANQSGITVNNADITINNSTIEGYCALNLWGANGSISVSGSTLSGTNNSTYTSKRGYSGNDFGVIVFESEGSSSGKKATDWNVMVSGSTINASQTTGNHEAVILYNPYATNNNVKFDGCTVTRTNAGTCPMLEELTGTSGNKTYVKNTTDSSTGDTPVLPEGYVYRAADAQGYRLIAKPVYVAQIGETKYETLASAVSAAIDGDTIEILSDVTLTSAVTLNKNLTITGNNKTITGTTSADMLVIGGTDKTITINNLTVTNSSTANYRRAICLYQAYGTTLTMSDCTISAPGYYAINVRGANENNTINLTNCSVSGYGTLNLWGDGGTININGGSLTGTNDAAYTSTRGYDGNDFGVIILEGEDSSSYAKNYNINVSGATINAVQTTGNHEAIVLYNPYATNNNVKFDGCTVTRTNAETCPILEELTGTSGNKTYVKNTKDSSTGDTPVLPDGYVYRDADTEGYHLIAKPVYVAEIVDGNKYETLQAAIDAAQAGQTVRLLSDISVSPEEASAQFKADFTVRKDLTIDGQDKTITVTSTGKGNVFQFYEDTAGNPVHCVLKDVTINSTGKQIDVLCGGVADKKNTLDISGVTITSQGECLYASDNAVITSSGNSYTKSGDYASDKDKVYYSAMVVGYGGVINSTGDTITSDKYAVATFPSGGTINLTDATVEGTTAALYSRTGNGVISAEPSDSSIVVNSGSKIKGGYLIEGTSTVGHTATMTLNGGIYSVNPSEINGVIIKDGYAVYNNLDNNTKEVYPYLIGEQTIQVGDYGDATVTIKDDDEKTVSTVHVAVYKDTETQSGKVTSEDVVSAVVEAFVQEKGYLLTSQDQEYHIIVTTKSTNGNQSENKLVYDVDPIASVTIGQNTESVTLDNDDIKGLRFTFSLDVTGLNPGTDDKVKIKHISKDEEYGTEVSYKTRNELRLVDNKLYADITDVTHFSTWELSIVGAGSAEGTYYGTNLSLDGNIGINLYVDVPEGKDDSDYNISYQYGNQTPIIVNLCNYRLATPVPGEDSIVYDHKVPVASVPAKEMCNSVEVKVYYQGGEDAVWNNTSSVKSLCDHYIGISNSINDAKLIALCESMLDYGSSAQSYFGYGLSGLANYDASGSVIDRGHNEGEPELQSYYSSYAEINSTLDDVVAPLCTRVGDNHGIDNVYLSLTTKSKTELNFYFKTTTPLKDYTVTVTSDRGDVTSEAIIETAERQPVSGGAKETFILVKIPNIAAARLNDTYNVKVAKNSDNYVEVNASALSYIKNLSSTNKEYKLANWLHWYYKKASEYFAG